MYAQFVILTALLCRAVSDFSGDCRRHLQRRQNTVLHGESSEPNCFLQDSVGPLKTHSINGGILKDMHMNELRSALCNVSISQDGVCDTVLDT